MANVLAPAAPVALLPQRRPGRSPTCCRPRHGRRASTTRRSASRALPACRRSSVITAGRRSSPPDARAELTGRQSDARSARLSIARALRGDGGRTSSSRACRTSTSASTSSTTCSRRPTARRWRTRSRRACRSSTRSSRASRSRCRRGTRCAGSRRSGCCGRRSSRCCRATIVRGRKRGFSIPAAAWLRGDLEPFARETLSPDTLRRQGFFQPEAVTRAARRPRRRPRGLSPPAVGPARVHALARASRRGHQARRAARGGASQ